MTTTRYPAAAHSVGGAGATPATPGWQVRVTWRVLRPGVTHPRTTSEHRPSEWAALKHAAWLVRTETCSSAVAIVRIELRDPTTGSFRTVHESAPTIDIAAHAARPQLTGAAAYRGEAAR